MSRKSTAAIDHEIAVLSAEINALHRREQDFTRVLDEMRRLLDSMKTEKLDLAAKIADLESQKHPINWLPAELLIHIFVFSTTVNADASKKLSFNTFPINLSHVCRKWRQITLSTSSLWSNILYQTNRWYSEPLETFLERSRASVLDITFAPALEADRDSLSPEINTVTQLVRRLLPLQSRWRSIAFGCNIPLSLDEIVEALAQTPASSLSHLQYLNLSILVQDPCFAGSSLLENEFLDNQSSVAENMSLTHVRLQQIPLSNIPGYLLSKVRTLELCYPLKAVAMDRAHHYTLRMSYLFRFLRYIPLLEELILEETAFFFNVVLQASANDGSTPSSIVEESALELPNLKSLVWKYAFPKDIYHLLSLINLPLLEHWHLSIASSFSKRVDLIQFRGNYDPDPFTQIEPLNSVVTLSALTELDICCQSEDNIGSSLRRFMFPSLQRLRISCLDTHESQSKQPLPPLPRLESIFRDPRLPHLTHLTLTHFDITREHGRAMPGYMPSLVSLSIGSCTGAGFVLTALSESCGTSHSLGRGVRMCPRLEELMLWDCPDIPFKSLFAAVWARDYRPEPMITQAAQQPGISEVETVSAVLGRAIRPLKKSRKINDDGKASSTQYNGEPAHALLSTMIPMSEALRPTPIAYVHIDNCPLISHTEALSLEEFGAVVSFG
ncbi:hypothetical protein BJ138DRAFT_1155292 [Hygrophoropsis aurantiaca]|uniref:Uncharacterized protein n=1 Tax=Hygrophoropsis aurantiaca TaxID=72124 RepID=A0ACB8A877_9AGAM|nr:hypothetical protein BJ138DRAFT_1155292 [Hygrophoropsis aurantiaca]